MKMKRYIIISLRVLLAIVTFTGGLLFFDMLFNHSHVSEYAYLGSPTLPVLDFVYEGIDCNRVQGCKKKMDVSYMRSYLTPINEDRTLSVKIDKKEQKIAHISYEVRSLDGERLIEDHEVTEYTDLNNLVNFDIFFQDLYEEGKEYSLMIVLSTVDVGDVYYYTQITKLPDNGFMEKVKFANFFSDTIYEGVNNPEDLIVYLESDSTGDNSSYGYVDIHSSYNQVIMKDLDVFRYPDVVTYIEDINGDIVNVSLEYLTTIGENKETRYFKTKESFRIKTGIERLYLLDYTRTMDEIIQKDRELYYGSTIVIGIESHTPELILSDNEDIVAFVHEGALFTCHSKDNNISEVFSLYDEEMDLRTLRDDVDIKVLRLDENGDMIFAVYGYIPRGVHEGEVGIILYSYTAEYNVADEILFIPYNKSPSLLKDNVGRGLFLGDNEELFCYMDRTMYSINLSNLDVTELITEIDDQGFKMSVDGSMISYLVKPVNGKSSEVKLLNLRTGGISSIKVKDTEAVYPLGFMENDLIYGIANRAEIYTDSYGNETAPMYAIRIRGTDGKIIKSYEEPGKYVTNIEINGNMIVLERVEMQGGAFGKASPDTIVNNYSEEVSNNYFEKIVTENYETIVQLHLANELNATSLKKMTAEHQLHDGVKAINIDLSSDITNYYVYHGGLVKGVYSDISQAVRKAYELGGLVVDDNGAYIWRKGNLHKSNQIMAIEAKSVNDDEGDLEVCLEQMLALEGYTADIGYMIDRGDRAGDILSEKLKDVTVLDLTLCSMDMVLYYVNQDIPVLAVGDNNQSFLIIGFNEYNVVLLDPNEGSIYKMGMGDATAMFVRNGNKFLTYIR